MLAPHDFWEREREPVRHTAHEGERLPAHGSEGLHSQAAWRQRFGEGWITKDCLLASLLAEDYLLAENAENAENAATSVREGESVKVVELKLCS